MPYIDGLKDKNIDELSALCASLRAEITRVVYQNGGHLSSNLGVVELTVALHRVFDFPTDKLIFDVGHQCYTHKLLTRDGFENLRKKGGLSGFPKGAESVYDCFDTGHSSTALSAACGFMRARNLKNEKYEIISVVGDGALGGGMCYEALNDSVNIGGKQIVVINDNNMTISATSGGIANFLHDTAKARAFFENFGFGYIGEIDGHNLTALIDALTAAKNSVQSVVVHIKTEKGKGCGEAESCPEKYHSVGTKNSGKSYAAVLGETLAEMSEKDGRIIAVTAAMKNGTGLADYANRFPQRFIDVGIAEAHAVTMCAALAKAGLKPYFAVYSSFLQRGFDQIVHDVMLQNAPVTFCIDHSGVVADDGETHQGLISTSYLRTADITILSPESIGQFKAMLKWSAGQNIPLAIRYPKGGESAVNGGDNNIVFGKWDYKAVKGEQGVVIYTGAYMANIARETAQIIMKNGLTLSTVNAKFLNPIDTELLQGFADKHIFVLEDNVEKGGLFEAVAAFMAENNLRVPVLKGFNFSSKPLSNMSVDEAYADYGLTAGNIAREILRVMK